MKKFMIFLLMAFLYLGTCQARSEASHPNDGKLKLLSWVSPTPSQSFLTPSGATASPSDVAVNDDVTFGVSIVGYETGCPNQPITLTAVIEGPLYSEVSYLWKLDGNAAPGVNNEQTYQFTPNAENGLNDGATHEFTVEVTPANCVLVVSPVHPFTMMEFTVALTGPAYTCAATSTYELVATVGNTSGSAPVSYQWYKGSDLFATTTENTLSVSADNLANNWKVKAVYNTMECTPESDVFAGANVKELKLVGTVGIAADKTTACADGQVVFTVTDNLQLQNAIEGYTLDTDPTYEWYVNGVLAATTTGTTYTTSFSQTGTQNVMVKPVYDNYDCTVLPTADMNVVINTAPALAINGDNVICDGQTTNNIVASAGFETYAWTVPAEATASNIATQNANKPGNYIVTATTAAADGACTATAEFYVTQFGSDLQLTASEYYVCPGDVVVLNANLNGWTNENITYAWKQPGETDYTVGGSTLVATAPATTGDQTYYVKATAADGCVNEGTIIVHVITPTDVTLTVTVSHNICVGDQVTATAKVNGVLYDGLCDWYVNGVQVPGEHAASITMNFDQPGEYTFAAAPANTVCSVINPTAVTTSNTVTVYDIPNITITGDNVMCQNTPATIMVTHIDNASYNWAMPVGNTNPNQPTLNSHKDTLTTTIPGVYAVTASLKGCEATAEFTIYQLGGDLQVYASEQDVCPGTSVMLNANLDGFGNQNISYLWSSEANSATTPTVVVTPTGNTTYYVTASATSTDFTQACQITSSISVNVITVGENPLLVNVTTPEGENMCVGGTIVAEASATPAVPYVTWFINGSEVEGQHLATLNLNIFEPGIYTFAAKPYDDPCNGYTPNEATKAVHVYAVPEVAIAGSNVVCEGATSNEITATVTGGIGTYTYDWTVPAGATAAANTSNVQNANVPGVYTLQVTDGTTGCVTEVDFTVYPAPAAPAIALAGNDVICDGQTTTLTATPGFASYAWTGPNAPAAPTTTNTLSNLAAGTYTVIGTTAEGCISEIASFTVEQTGGHIELVADNYNICSGESVVLTATFTGFENEAVSYDWNISGHENESSITVAPTTTTTYTVSAGAGDCQVSASVTINVTQMVTVTTTVTNTLNTVVLCQGQQLLELTATANNVPTGVSVDSYTWYLDGVEIPGQNLDFVSLNINELGYHAIGAKANLEGCYVTPVSEDQVFVFVTGAPELTISGNNSICFGDTAVLVAHADFTPVLPLPDEGSEITHVLYSVIAALLQSDFTYEWSDGTDDATMKTVNDGVYTVTATHAAGCSATASINVTTFGGQLQLTADQMEICEGESVMLNAQMTGWDNENVSYVWYENTTSGANTLAHNVNSLLVSPTATTTYTVKAYNMQPDMIHPDGSCFIYQNIVITVHPRPSQPSVSLSDNNICAGEQLTLTVNGSSHSNSYTWYVNGQQLAGENRPHFTMNMDEPGDYVFQARTINQYGCESLNTSVSDPDHTVHVHAIPTITLSGNNVICDGDYAAITANATTTPDYSVGPYHYDYEWSDGSDDAVLLTYYDGTYTVTVTDQYGCSNTASIEVTRFGGDLQITADNMNICVGDNVTLTAHFTGWQNMNTYYRWYDENDNLVSSAYEPTVNVSPTSTTQYYVEVSSDMFECTKTAYITITVNPTPSKPTLELSTHNICAGEQVTLTADHPGSGNNYTYTWYQNGIVIEGENTREITLTLDEAGEYMFRVSRTSAAGCTSQLTTPTNGTMVTVHPTPVVTLSGDPYYTTDATTATITSSVLPAGNYTYAWSNGENTPDITVGTPGGYGVYTLTVTSEYGCTAVSEPFTVSSVVDLQANIVGATAACQHDIVTLSAVVDYDLEGHTYKWLVNNQYITDAHGISGSETAHLTFPVDSIYTYYGAQFANEFTVEIYREGCTTPVISPVHPFLITPIPFVTVASPAKVCEGSDAILEAVVYQIGDNAQYQYIWYQDDAETVYGDPINYVNTITIPAADVAGHQYAVKVVYQDVACSSDLSDFVEVEIYEAPVDITMTLDPSTICTTNQATLTISDDNAGEEGFGEATYTWYMNGIELPLVHGDIFTADFDHNGEYTFWATASYAEYPCAVITTNTVVENVVMHPTVQITGDPIICHDDAVLLYANVNDTVGSMDYTYEWRLYNYTLGDQVVDTWIPFIGNISVPNPIDEPAFLDEPILSNAILGTDYFLSTPLTAQDYPYTFTVVVTTPEGCHVESAPFYLYVGAEPEVVATVDYTEVCTDGEITATAHLGNWNMDNLTAQWLVRTYNEETDTWSSWSPIAYGTSGILHHVPGVTSQYRIRVEQTTTGCVAYSAPVTVNVLDPAQISSVVAINGNVNFPTDNVCEGAQLDITAYMYVLDEDGNPVQKVDEDGNPVFENGEPVYEEYVNYDLTYMWKLNGMELQNEHGPWFSAQAYIYDGDPVDYTYEAYVVYDIPGCSIVPVASNTVHVKKNPIVTIDGNPNVCYYGETYPNVELQAWVDGIADLDATYTWYESGQYRPNPLGADNSYLETWTPNYDNPLIFTVTVTNGDGCTGTSEPFYVNVYDKPGVNITGDADAICEGGNVTLRANLDNYHQPMIVFQWFKDQVNNTHIIPGATHEIETFTPTESTDYIVVVKHLTVFTLTEDLCVTYDTFHVDVNPIPVVSAEYLTPDQTSVCEGQTISILAGVVSGGVEGGEVYTWYRNGEVIEGFHGSVLTDNPVAVDGEPTVYHYAVSVRQSASGCESLIFNNLADITVNPNPVVELVTDPIVCDTAGNNITLFANVEPAPATSVSYLWMEDNDTLTITPNNTLSLHRDYRDYPYSFSVELVNLYGCNAESSALVYVNAKPIVNITATETNICAGGQVTLTATLNDWNADQLTFQWFDGNDPIDGATELSYTVVPTLVGNQTTHNYHVEILQLTSLCEATSNVVPVTVNADPVVTINYAADQYTVCDGYQVDLTTTVTGGVTGGEVYTWYRNGQVIEGANQATYSEVVSALNGEPTTYNYAVSVAQAAAGCESNVYNDLQTITVNPNPVLALITDPIVCDTTGDNITLTANLDPANVGSTVTFNWMEDNAPMNTADYTVVANNQITLHKPYRDFPYSFAVQVVNDYACSATSEAQVYVNANPIVNTTVTEDTICVGGEITMTLNLNDWNANQLTFQWYDNGVAIPGATSLSYTVVPETEVLDAPVAHEYFVKVFQLTSECEAYSEPFTVTVNPDPIITSVTVDGNLYNVCTGAQLAITATPADGNVEGEVYTWYRNGILLPGATAATIFDTPGTIDNNIQQYVYTAVVTRPQAGCSSLPVSSATVTVYPNPVVVITGDQHVCETDSVFLIANVDTTAFAVGNLHFTWYESGQIRNNDAYGLGDSRFFAEYFYPRDEPYIFTVNAERNDIEHGCASMSGEFYVYVYPQPVVTVTASEEAICAGGQVTLTANLIDNNAQNLVYQWYEIRFQDVVSAVDYNVNHSYMYDTNTVAYRYLIPGANNPTYATTIDSIGAHTYGVMVIQTNSTCMNDDEIVITVNPVPVVTDVTVNGVAVDTVCDGAQVTLAAYYDANNTEGEPIFTWYRNGILIEGANQAVFSENVYTTDNHVTYNYYSVVVTLPHSGCVSEMSSMAATLRINPAPSTVSISGVNVICENDTTTLHAYSDVEGEWTWSYDGSHADSIVVPAGVYTVTMRTVEGCEMTSEPFTVEAFGTDLLVSASATSICRGEHTTLYVDQDGWQGNVTYQWDAQALNSTATTVDVQPDSTTTYHVTATVSSTNGSCTAEGEVTIIVHQLPAAFEVTASTNVICEGQQITFTAPVDPEVTGYIWYQNGIEIPGENQNAITINFNEAGQYTFAAKAISIEGCISAEASAPVTITVNPAPSQVTITGVNVLCENSTTTLTAQSDVPGIFVWSTGDTAATVTVPAGSYNVTIYTAEGCQLTSDNFNVEAFGTDLLVSASATSICQGEHTTLYVDQEGWQGNVTYLWDAQAGNSTATTVDVQPDQTTTYHVTATVSSTNGTCTAEGEVTIIVHPLPAQLVVNATTATTICQGDQVSFHATGDSTTTAYIWYQNGVEIPGENQSDLTVNYNEYGTYSISAKAISNEGCISALASEPVVVTVKPAPTTVTITGNNVLCMTDSTTLTAHSDVEGVFTWNNGHEGATMTVAAGVYNVTITTAEGCHLTSDNFTVESFGTDINVSASATSICQGEHTTLYVDQDGWQGNVTYLWDAQAGNSTATTVDVQPAATTTYHVTATVVAESGSCTAEGEVTIIVHPLPAQLVVNATTATTICQGDQVSFHATGDTTTTAYIWYQNGVEIPGENQADLIVNYNEYGNYTISAKAISNEGCISALASEPVPVVVKPAPTTVTITGTNVLCQNDSTTLYAHSDVAGVFTWNDGTTGPTKVVTEGVYNVTLTTPEGCHLTSENFTVESFGTDLLVSASATSICQGEHTTLYVDQDGWQGNVTYAWDAQAGNSTATTVDVQPEATTTYHVTATVTTNNNHACTAEGTVTIIVNPLPVVAGVTASETTVCEGTQVTFTATGDENTTAYIWYNNGVEIPGENQAVLTVNFNEQGVYNYSVKAISNENCVSAIAVAAPAVTVNAAPESVTISADMTTICDGGSTTLYANVVPNEPATYQWFYNNNEMDVTTASIVVNNAGSYKVVASFNGCSTESDAVVITVEQAPQLQLSATEYTICAGGTTVITAEPTGYNNEGVNYEWSCDQLTGFSYEGSTYTFNAANAGTFTFEVTASQATSGCTATDQITITVNELPATPVVTVDNALVCEGGPVTLTVTNPNSNAVYTWYRNNFEIADAHNAQLTETPLTVGNDTTSYTYTVVATLPMSGCSSLVSASTVVTVVPAPEVYVSVIGSTTLCGGTGHTTLRANVTPVGDNTVYSYQWYKDNVMIDGATDVEYVASEIARETPYLYKVVVTSNYAGCEVSAEAPAITFVNNPEVEVTISNNISCVGGTATLTAVVDGGVANVNGLNGYHFAWHNNTSASEVIGTDSPVFVTDPSDAPGEYAYWVTVSSNYGCESSSQVVNYTVVADPQVTITVAAGYPQAVCDGGESMLKANVTGGYGEVSYQWYMNGNPLVGETNQTLAVNNLSPNVNDVYTVEVTQTGVGCANGASVNIHSLITVVEDYTVAITGYGNVCEGGSLELNAVVSTPLNGDQLYYQWYKVVNGNASPVFGGINATQYQTSELVLGDYYEYYVVVTSIISGCGANSNTVPVNVVAAPTVAIQGAHTVCANGDLTLNAFVYGGVDTTAYTYTWSWTGAANGTATTAVPTYVTNLNASDAANPYYFTVTISRNDNSGCTATSAAHEVNVQAVPTVTVTADNNYICQSGDVTFTAHVSPVGTYTYDWTINGQAQAAHTASLTTTLANTGTVSATVVVRPVGASGSCDATATIVTPVTVVAAPTVNLTANHTQMCVGGVTTLTATVNVDSHISNNFNYEWIVDGAPVPGVTNVLNQTLNAAGVHTYKVRVSQNNTLGCESSWSNVATVQVAEQPVVTLTSENGLAICEGGSITLTGIVTNYGNNVNGVTNSDIYGTLTFDWTSNGVNVHHNTSNNAMNQVTETLNNVGNYTYQVTVSAAPTAYNCQPQISNEYTVNVVSNPTWTDVHVYSNNGTDACLGEMVYLMAGIEGGAFDGAGITGGHIQWVVTDTLGNTYDVDGGLGGTSYDIPDAAGTYIYTPTFIGNIGSGCLLNNTEAQVAVTVHELPTAEFVSGDGTALCGNDPSASAELVISFTGEAPFTYEVVDAAGNIIAHATTFANTATIYVAPEFQTTYRINLISDNFCENPAVGDAIVATVYVNDIEFADNVFAADCDTNEVTIAFNMISGNPNAAFTVVYDNYNPGHAITGVISNNTATFETPDVAGEYTATITIDGCTYDIVVRVPMSSHYSYNGTLPLMDQRWNDVVVVNCNTETNGGHVFVGFQWYHNGVAIPGATYSNYQDKGGLNGFYSVELVELLPDGSMITYMTCEESFSGNSYVKVYPVPANVRQEITIELELTSEELDGAVLDIYSVTGAHISHVTDLQPITKIQGFTAQGTYFGRILTGTNEIKTVKFIIVK